MSESWEKEWICKRNRLSTGMLQVGLSPLLKVHLMSKSHFQQLAGLLCLPSPERFPLPGVCGQEIPHHHLTTSPSPHHLTTSPPHHHLTTSPSPHHLTTSPPHHHLTTTPPPHHLITSPPHHFTTTSPADHHLTTCPLPESLPLPGVCCQEIPDHHSEGQVHLLLPLL